MEQERAFVDCLGCEWRRYAQPLYAGVEVGPMGLSWQVESVCHRCGSALSEPAVIEVVDEPSPAEIANLLKNFTAPLVDAGLLKSAA